MVQTCVSDLKRVSAENTAARNECADVSQQLIVSKSMVVDLQEVLHVSRYACQTVMVNSVVVMLVQLCVQLNAASDWSLIVATQLLEFEVVSVLFDTVHTMSRSQLV